MDPEPIREHYVVVGRRRYPPKQVLAALTELDRGDEGQVVSAYGKRICRSPVRQSTVSIRGYRPAR